MFPFFEEYGIFLQVLSSMVETKMKCRSGVFFYGCVSRNSPGPGDSAMIAITGGMDVFFNH